jgi:hypothetical protein
MSDVNIRPQQTIASDDGLHVFSCAAVEGAKLTDCRVIANFKRRYFILKFQILRKSRDNSTVMNPALFPDARAVCAIDMWSDLSAVADNDIIIYHGKWTDGNIVADQRLAADNCCGVNLIGHRKFFDEWLITSHRGDQQ